jgi:hypothetical protein
MKDDRQGTNNVGHAKRDNGTPKKRLDTLRRMFGLGRSWLDMSKPLPKHKRLNVVKVKGEMPKGMFKTSKHISRMFWDILGFGMPIMATLLKTKLGFWFFL